MERFEKEAMPETAATVVVPESVPPPGFATMAMVTLADDPVTVLPKLSWTVTWTAGAIEVPAAALVGWTMKASLFAAAGVMLNAAEVAAVSPPEVATRV